MSNVRQLLDNGVPIYPITDKSLVLGLQDAPFEYYVVAWDGASTPVPANIPAGVVVTYNGTDYTGTLAAGSATAPYLYLVASASQPGEYDRYITTHPGSSYVWTPLGSTAPVSPVIADDLVTNDSSKALSAKQGKILNDKTSELEAKVTDLSGKMPISAKTITETIDTSSTIPGYGKYIKQDGTVASYNSYMISNPITMRPGDRIVSSAVAGGTQIFAKYLGDYSSFDPIPGYFVGSNQEYPIDWTADEYCQVVICGTASRMGTYTLITEGVDDCAAQSAVVLGWILTESFTSNSITRDANGAVSSAIVLWPDGKTGSITITRDTMGLASSVVALYDESTYTMAIVRDSDGNVTSYNIS